MSEAKSGTALPRVKEAPHIAPLMRATNYFLPGIATSNPVITAAATTL
jgi:hypothetical protein